MAPLFEFDPTSEAATNSPLEIWSTTDYAVTAFDAPTPPLTVQWAGSVDTEGSLPAARKHENRTITVTVDITSVTGLRNLQMKLGKIAREGGTAKLTFPNSEVIIFDLHATDTYEPQLDITYYINTGTFCTVQFSLIAKPYGRGVEVDLGDNVETTLPCIVFTDTGVKGDLPALARLVIDNDDATNDQAWMAAGIQSRYYDSAATAALFYEAEGRTALGGAATAAGPSGASGAGSNVVRHTALTTIPQAILSTQATGGGAHLSHIGTFRVYARVQVPTTNAGSVSVALEWGEGDFRRTTINSSLSLAPSTGGAWRLLDLGLVSPRQVTAGTQRWEGRVLASSTVSGDDLDIDWIILFPVDEGYYEIASVYRIPSPSTFAARDEFDQTAGNLAAKTLPIGGTWTEAGGTASFTVDATGHQVLRQPTTSTDVRLARAGVTSWTDVVVQANVGNYANPGQTFQGIFARYVDTSNYLVLYEAGGTGSVELAKRIAGVETLLLTVPNVRTTNLQRLTLYVSASGVWIAQREGVEIGRGHDPVLATGGTLATGGAGLYDHSGIVPPNPTNAWDNFAVWVPPPDAAIFATRSLEARSDVVRRQDSGGTLWVEPSSFEGFYPKVPSAGAEARTVRVIVKASRGLPLVGTDGGTDDISARLFYTPRYLVVPTP